MTDTARKGRSERTAWVGLIIFAAVMMIILGSFHAMQGAVAILKDDFYVVGPEDLVLTIDITAWGWTHLLLGIVTLLAGFAVLNGVMWARVVGIVIAVFSVLANAAFLGADPVWGALSIAIGIMVIYALTAHGEELKPRD
jgi:hypothetical protein